MFTPRQLELAHERCHERVLDRETGEWLSLDEYMGTGDYGSVIEHRRVGLKLQLIGGQLRYVCPVCEQAMALASIATRDKRVERFYFRHQDRHSPCIGMRGLSAAAICALKFGHRKEGAAHKQLKAWLLESLSADPTFSAVDPEKRWLDIDGIHWRQPDVQGRWNGRRVAFEAQLSTTFLHVIAERMRFYTRNDGRLLWLFRDLDPTHFALTEDDIFYTNNRNAFRVGADTVALSRSTGRFALECLWLEPMDQGGWTTDDVHLQMVFFDQLQFDTSAHGAPRAYYFNYERALSDHRARWKALEEVERQHREQQAHGRHLAEDQALRDELEALVAAFPKQWDTQRARWAPLRARFRKRGFQLPDEIFRASGPLYLLMAAYSAKRGKVVCCDLTNFMELANNLYGRHKDCLWVFSVMMRHYQRAPEMRAHGDQKKWIARRNTYLQAWRNGDAEYAPNRRHDDLLAFLFPDAASALLRDPKS